MEAGNRGATKRAAKSIGLNIVLPHEQEPNAYITPRAVLPVPLLRAAQDALPDALIALVCFPGGFGTLDELFEDLTLVQTGKSRRAPSCCSGASSGAG
jgi:predicted Rossmann-fold nucleotide-binding protein